MKNINKTTGDRVFDVINAVIMILLAITFIYPFWDTLVISFADKKTVSSYGLHLFPQWPPIFESYAEILTRGKMITAFKNSVFRTVTGTIIMLYVTFTGAYVLSKRDMPFNKTITFVILFTMFFSGGLIPYYLLIKNLGLMDSMFVLILPTATSAWYLLLTRNFINTLPASIEESALIDGAGVMTVIFRILLPMSTPIIAVLALWSAVGHWNAWFDAFIYINSNDKVVLQLLLRRILIENSDELLSELPNNIRPPEFTPDSLKATTIIIALIPIACVYPFLQKYFVKGIHVGAIKG